MNSTKKVKGSDEKDTILKNITRKFLEGEIHVKRHQIRIKVTIILILMVTLKGLRSRDIVNHLHHHLEGVSHINQIASVGKIGTEVLWLVLFPSASVV